MLYLDLLLYVIILCSFIPFWVFLVLGWQVVSWNNMTCLRSESNVVELVWTVFPSVAVALLCFFNLFCLGDTSSYGVMEVVKAVGRQWYWSYETVGLGSYDSFMGDYLDSVDKPLRLRLGIPYLVLVTSADVIHSFALPQFGLKLDAVPGRVNQAVFCPDRVGVFVGYCSELCGAGHAFMPIVVEVVSKVSRL